jgi:hypothetical protein
MTQKEAFKNAFLRQNIPDDLAEKCAQILVNDGTRDRTKQEQETIDKAFAIANNLSQNWRQGND